MKILETHTTSKQAKPIRFQEYGVGIFKTIPTKSSLKKAIKKELIFIDKSLATTSKYILGGEKIELLQSKETSTFKRLKLPLEVVFEDNFLAIINKPAGVLVSGNSFKTVDNALMQNLTKSTQSDAVRPRPVHRLDYPTTGLLLVGKTSSSILALNKLFENKEIKKTYHAITIGKMKIEGEINLPIDSKEALSKYNVLQTVVSERFNFLNLVELSPKTGRKHQLRKHLASLENYILGDKEYGTIPLILNGKGLYLHASTLAFVHPFTKENISLTQNLPKKFKKIFPH